MTDNVTSAGRRFISSRVVVALKKEAKPAMSNENWQDKLKSCFEDLAQVEKRKKETLENFGPIKSRPNTGWPKAGPFIS
jgi:hypothetical protein